MKLLNCFEAYRSYRLVAISDEDLRIFRLVRRRHGGEVTDDKTLTSNAKLSRSFEKRCEELSF